MKLSNKKIIESIQSLSSLYGKQLPVKVSYIIAKNTSNINDELKIYNKEREKLITKYAEKDEEGKEILDEHQNIIIKKACVKSWNEDVNTLLSLENDVEISKFKIDELSDFNISPAELSAIDFMIEG